MRTQVLILAVTLLSLRLMAEEPAPKTAAASVVAMTSPTGPATVADLRPEFQRWELGPRRQGGRPTCSTFTVASAIEFATAKRQRRGQRLSVEFLNWASNQACGDKEDGGFFSDLWRGFTTYGICTEEEMPYRAVFDPAQSPSAAAMADAKPRLGLGLRLHWIKEWDVKTGLADSQVTGIKHVLDQGWPVCGGFRWPKKAQWENDVLRMCPADAVYDGHSVVLVGYREESAAPGEGVFLFRNTAGEGRDAAMPYAYARAYMNDAVWVDYEVQPQER